MAELLVLGSKIQVVGTHLQNSGPVWLRKAQCVELSERLLKPSFAQGIPQIVCGDFNINKLSSDGSYGFMLSSLEAEDGELTGENQFSYDRIHNDLQTEEGDGQDLIDYILLRPNGAWVDCSGRSIQMIRKKWHNFHLDLSDHYSVAAEFHFAPSLPISLR